MEVARRDPSRTKGVWTWSILNFYDGCVCLKK